MDHIGGHLGKYKNIILKGFDPVSAGGFTQVPNYILRSSELTVGDLNPGVICSASANRARAMLYSKSE